MSDNSDFFNKAAEAIMGDQEEQVLEPEKIKLGEDEYTQDELNRLVGLGKIGAEAEEKYGIKLDKVWPNTQKTINEKLELEKQLNDLKSQVPTKQPTEQELSEQQISEKAKAELSRLGYVQKDEVEKIAFNMVQGYQLRQGAQASIDNFTEQGYPRTTVDEVLQHMVDTGINSPEKAYKDMFEGEIDKIKEQKLQSLKPSAFVTTSQSNAGSKSPAPQKITSKNLQDALLAVLPD